MLKRSVRDERIDVVKGLAIFLVVLGHCIQYGSGAIWISEKSYFEDVVFKFIYSFHMPLFMLISGYLFYFVTLKRTWIETIKGRITGCLIPILAWGGVKFCLKLSTLADVSLISFFKNYISTCIYSVWFLWAILYCSIVVIFVNRFLKDSYWVYLLGFCLTFFVPDVLGSAAYKFMYPFFILGYLYNKEHKKLEEILRKLLYKKWATMAMCVFVFAVLLSFYDVSSYIYTTGYYILNKTNPLAQGAIDLYRFVIGLIGSVTVIFFVNSIKEKIPSFLKNSLVYLGRNSLGIYIISDFGMSTLKTVTANFGGVNYIASVVQAIILILVSLIFNAMIQKNAFTNKIFLGGR